MSKYVLTNIVYHLNQYLSSMEMIDPTKDEIVLGNVAMSKFAGGNNENLEDKVIVQMVNIAEESSLKTLINRRQEGLRFIEYPPEVNINLYLLFAANYGDHEVGIRRIFRVIEFFQGKKHFNTNNSPLPTLNGADDEDNYFEVDIDLHTLSFEQLNDLWGSLGGKQIPFVLYRVRLITLNMELPKGGGGLVTEIELETQS